MPVTLGKDVTSDQQFSPAKAMPKAGGIHFSYHRESWTEHASIPHTNLTTIYRLLLESREGLTTTIIHNAQNPLNPVSNIITIIVQREKKAWRKCLARALIQISAVTSH